MPFQIALIVTDNSTNMVKAVRCMKGGYNALVTDNDGDDDGNDINDDKSNEAEEEEVARDLNVPIPEALLSIGSHISRILPSWQLVTYKKCRFTRIFTQKQNISE